MGLQTRQQWEEKERQFLSPYSQFSADSFGRQHAEPSHLFRSEYQRDRDRIIHSSAFRRLEYKTQVVLNGTGDHFRTRLTHTIEVASITRTTARTLGLNEDLAEAIALAHDLGHPPFGHPGEHTLNQLMKDHGGFEHNRQSLRVVDELEMKYPEFNGINLTWETREGLSKHFTGEFTNNAQPSLEAQVADSADEIAYSCNDLDDALEHCLIAPEELKDIALWSMLEEHVNQRYSKLEFTRRRRYIIRCLIDHLVEDLCQQSAVNIEHSGIKSANEARKYPQRLIGFSLTTRANIQNLRDFLLEHFYYHPNVSRVNQRACKVLQHLFEFYHKHPHLIGHQAALRIKKEGTSRAVCDYIAGMTDGYALKMYGKHIGTDYLLSELLSGNTTR
ncbi:MAG: deoxyguanosinetriphosphate triphosphohydrolase [Verrucomicrobiales bacterium]|jgi:dGTPase|nr:deoxyguanosinetriphosphate triphosphohydrolase [Verrucomicrobiales bacterium]